MFTKSEIEIYNLELDDIIVTSEPWDEDDDGVHLNYSNPSWKH